MTLSQTIFDFTTLAIKAGGWMDMDRLYLQNRVLGMIGEDAMAEAEVKMPTATAVELMDELVATAKANGMIGKTLAEQEIFEAQLMDLMTPPFCCQCLVCATLC